MEMEDVESDLHTLKKLYGLLQSKGNNNNPKKATSQNLDDKARLVLKKLLDGATKQAIQSLPQQVIEDKPKLLSLVPPDTYSNTSPSMVENSKDSDKDQECHSFTSQSRKRCRVCGRNRDLDHRRHPTGLELQKGLEPKVNTKGSDQRKKPMLNQIHEVHNNGEVTSSSKMWFRSEPAGNKYQNPNESKKPEKGVDAEDVIQQMQACVKKVNPVVKNTVSVATMAQTNIIKDGNVEKNGITEAKAITSDHESGHVSVAEAIRKFEACIKANQQEVTHRVDSMKGRKEEHNQPSKMSQLEKKDESTQTSKRFEAQAKIIPSRPSKNENELPLSQKVRPLESTTTLPASKAATQTSRRFEAQAKTMPSRTSKPVGFSSNENELLLSQKVRPLESTTITLPASIATTQTCKPTLQFDNPQSKCTDKKLGNTNKPYQIMDHPGKQVLPRQKDGRVVVRTTAPKRFELPSHPPSLTKERLLSSEELMLNGNNTRNRCTVGESRPARQVPLLNRPVGPNRPKESLVRPPRRNGLTGQMNEPRPLVTSQRLCRTRDNMLLPTLLDQQLTMGPDRGKFGGGTHRNPSVQRPRQQQSHGKYATSDSESNSESESESRSVTDTESCSTGRSDPAAPSGSESYSTSGSATQESCSSESELDQQPRRMLTLHRSGPTSRDTWKRHDSLVVPSIHVGSSNEKDVGRLRRFKNKLGIIFHHYHHHHHHHHDGQEVGHTLDHDHHRSLWKYMGDMLHHSNSKDKAKRSAVRSAPRQHHQGHLHTLVEGLLRHVRHSKKSKRSSAEVRRLSKSGNRTRKRKAVVVKKWHWWQKLYRRGSSNSVKPRVKVGFRARRPLLSGT